MKTKTLTLSVLTLVTALSASAGTTHIDRISCAITAKVGSNSHRLKDLPKTLSLKMDAVVDGGTEIMGLEKKLYQKEWNRYSYSMVGTTVNQELDELLQISSVRKYTTNDIYVNRSGIHNNRVKEFKVKMKKIGKDRIGFLLSEMGYSENLQSKADKNLSFSTNTEYFDKVQTVTVKFSEEDNTTAIFTFKCKNSIQLGGRQFY